MSGRWRAVAVPLPGAVLLTVVWRSPYLAPLVFGARQWLAAWRRDNPTHEPEIVG